MQPIEAKISWNPSTRMDGSEKYWDQFRTNQSITLHTARKVVERFVSQGLIQQTVEKMGTHLPSPHPFIQIQLLQQGLKYGVFHIGVSEQPEEPETEFLFILSKSGLTNNEMRDDFCSLSSAKKTLTVNGIRTFIPEPYTLSTDQDTELVAMAVEFLENHGEVNSQPTGALYDFESPYAELRFNSNLLEAVSFNGILDRSFNDLIEASRISRSAGYQIPKEVSDNSPHYLIQTIMRSQIIARLHVIHRLTGRMPRSFSLNAGDFVAVPSWEDLDLHLTSFRGGSTEISEFEFIKRLLNHQERIFHTIKGDITYTAFTEDDITTGIRIGDQMLTTAPVLR